MKEFKVGDKVHDVLTLKNGVIIAYCNGYANIKFNDGIVNYPKEIMSLINHGHLDHENFTYEPVCKVKATPKPKPKKYHVEFETIDDFGSFKTSQKFETIYEFIYFYKETPLIDLVLPEKQTGYTKKFTKSFLTSVKLIKD